MLVNQENAAKNKKMFLEIRNYFVLSVGIDRSLKNVQCQQPNNEIVIKIKESWIRSLCDTMYLITV